ncbi:hypothetical protein EVAR_74947_1 [Eumeta japonica]|uniref:Uncharacterized protein n=1 Tax=Eumeta variegata TaxID=151549 RepID=A0A4C1UID0_EUMVA|nr:hypothetical protein EVAR_74947_1 [Eumeta japonica]
MLTCATQPWAGGRGRVENGPYEYSPFINSDTSKVLRCKYGVLFRDNGCKLPARWSPADDSTSKERRNPYRITSLSVSQNRFWSGAREGIKLKLIPTKLLSRSLGDVKESRF